MIKSFYVNRPSRYSFIAVGLLLLAAVSATLIYLNRGLYFADFHASELVQITGEGNASVLDQFINSPYVARIDRDHGILEFQSVPTETFNKLVADVQAMEGVTGVQVITQMRILPADLVGKLVWGGAATLLITLMCFYVMHFRKLLKINRVQTIRISSLYFIALGVGLLITFGVISLFSRFYLVSDISMASMLLAYIWGVGLLFIVFQEMWGQNGAYLNQTQEILALNRRRLTTLNKVAAVFWIIILLGAIVGLGKRFVVEAVLIGAGVAFVSLCLEVLPSFLIRLNTRDLGDYRKRLTSYNLQAVPIYNEQVKKSKRRSGSKRMRPKRRQ